MSIGAVVAAVLFGPESPPRFAEAGLSWRGAEVSVTGYGRVRVEKGGWDVADNVASATVRFGPFRSQAQVDGAFLVVGDAVIDLPLEGDVRLLPGMEFEHRVEVTFGG